MNSINEIESFLGINETKLHNDFYCVLTGQFSTGKSKFLNRLFGVDYLPVGTREMTATPTYIRKGEDVALVYRKDECTKVPLSEVKEIKKGTCDCEKIEMSVSCLNVSDNLVFIDTPGINSISFNKCDYELNQADVVLYFLAKNLSAVDVEVLDDICNQRDIKLVFVRTRIDDIKGSEENIYETYDEESAIIMSMYPNAKFFFVSLNDDNCNLNQIAELISYVKFDLEKELEQHRAECMNDYIANTLSPALKKMKKEIEFCDNKSKFENLMRKTQKQLKAIKKSMEEEEGQIRNYMNMAKKNYLDSGCGFIDKCIANKGKISLAEIKAFVINCMRKFEIWYELEFEDLVTNISVNESALVIQELISDEVLSQIFSRYEKNRNRFINFSILEQDYSEKMDDYSDAVMAKAYLKKVMTSIFIRIEAGFSESYFKRIDEIVKELSSQYTKENELIQKYSLYDFVTINRINDYIMELDNYGIK